MMVSLPQLRAIGLGAPMTPEELDAWVRSTVALFLGGYDAMTKRATPAGLPGSRTST